MNADEKDNIRREVAMTLAYNDTHVEASRRAVRAHVITTLTDLVDGAHVIQNRTGYPAPLGMLSLVFLENGQTMFSRHGTFVDARLIEELRALAECFETFGVNKTMEKIAQSELGPILLMKQFREAAKAAQEEGS